MVGRFILRPVTEKTVERDAAEIQALTQKLIDSGDLIEGIHYPLGRRKTFAEAVANDLRRGLERKSPSFIGSVACADVKTGKIVSYVGMMLRKRLVGTPERPVNESQALFRPVAKYPSRTYGWVNWDITDPAYRSRGLATKLTKKNIEAFRKRFKKTGKSREIFSRVAYNNPARRRLDEKTGFKEVLGVIGTAARRYSSGKGIIARKEVRPMRKRPR